MNILLSRAFMNVNICRWMHRTLLKLHSPAAQSPEPSHLVKNWKFEIHILRNSKFISNACRTEFIWIRKKNAICRYNSILWTNMCIQRQPRVLCTRNSRLQQWREDELEWLSLYLLFNVHFKDVMHGAFTHIHICIIHKQKHSSRQCLFAAY